MIELLDQHNSSPDRFVPLRLSERTTEIGRGDNEKKRGGGKKVLFISSNVRSMLESKLKSLVPSVILLQRQLILQLDGNVIRNTFYDNEPKYISLIHPYISQYEIGISQFLSQIVALKAFEDTSYLNLLSPMQKKNKKTKKKTHYHLSVHPSRSFSSHTSPLFHPDTLFWNHSVCVTFSQCGARTTHDCASVQIRSIISTHRYH